jgi:hypothetical protein
VALACAGSGGGEGPRGRRLRPPSQ